MEKYILAVDQGTSGTKCIVFSPEGEAVASASVPLETVYGRDGTVEQDPEGIYRGTVSAVGAAVVIFEAELGVPRERIACAGIANQRETFVLWDRSGVPLYDAVVWQCKRSVGICTELEEGGAEGPIRERSGLIADPYFSGTKAAWLLRNNPGVEAAYERGDAFFGTVDTWLLHRLTGGSVHATDHTNASRTLLFNIHTLEWDGELARILRLERLRLPEVHPSAHHYGESDFGGVFSAPIPITAMIGDSHAAFFGGRCFEPGSAKATLGTGCSILLNAGSAAPRPYPSTMSTVGFSLPGRVDYALEGIIVSAGALLTWLRREMGLYDDPSQLEAAAIDAGDAGGVTIVPGHAGLGAPFWRMDARGSIHGLTFGTGKGHVIRAALECIPYQIRAIIDAVGAESGIRCSSLRVDGGISRNGFVVGLIADTLGVPVRTFPMPDITARGAAFLAGLGAGIYTGIESIGALEFDEPVLAPGPGAAAAIRGYAAWKEVVEKACR